MIEELTQFLHETPNDADLREAALTVRGSADLVVCLRTATLGVWANRELHETDGPAVIILGEQNG